MSKITAEYIFGQIEILSKEDLIILIEEYGEQEAKQARENVNLDNHYGHYS